MDKFIVQDNSHSESHAKNINWFKRCRPETTWIFDYEVNNVDVLETKNSFTACTRGTKDTIQWDNFSDTIEGITADGAATAKLNLKHKANWFKRWVSKKKHRISNEYFDLDMAYITPHILAMGFPATGCEKYYRNSLVDSKFFLDRYHKDYKIYNLCLEDGRIYQKGLFDGKKVALFPFMDHNPCPIKLMLEFCTDVCWYLTLNPQGIAAIHCKAGKGRTGIMIVCYWIFSGLCKDTNTALTHYANWRTINGKGVTIPSQIRYIEYFETFLAINFVKPYYKMIPQIMQFYITPRVENTLRNYINEDDYFYQDNYFTLQYVKMGPFKKRKDYKIEIGSLIQKKIEFKNAKKRISLDQKNINLYYLTLEFNSLRQFNYDWKLECQAFVFKFSFWLNLWFETWKNIFNYIKTNNLIQFETKFSDISLSDDILTDNPTILSDSSLLSAFTPDMTWEPFSENTEWPMKNITDEIESNKQENGVKCNNTNNGVDENINSDTVINTATWKNNVMHRRSSIRRSSMGRLIKELKRNKNIVRFVDGINKYAEEFGIPPFTINNQIVTWDKKRLDKFKDWLHIVNPDFKVEYCFSLEENK